MIKDNTYTTTWECPDTGAEWPVRMGFDHQPEEEADYEEGVMVYPGCDEDVTIGDVERYESILVSGAGDVGASWALWEGFAKSDLDQWEQEILELIKGEV